MMFAVAPCLLQIPFALYLFLRLIRNRWFPKNLWLRKSTFSSMIAFLMRMDKVIRIIFAIKPIIDAVSTLLFLGEYRHHSTAVAGAVRRIVRKLLTGTSDRASETKVQSVITVSAAPSGIRQKAAKYPTIGAAGKSASLPINITSIST